MWCVKKMAEIRQNLATERSFQQEMTAANLRVVGTA
jgi:hypothetical protein